MTNKEAVSIFKTWIKMLTGLIESSDNQELNESMSDSIAANELAIQALEEPRLLMLEELNKLDGTPVYCIGIVNRALDGWGLINANNKEIVDSCGSVWIFGEIGKTYNAYIKKPELSTQKTD